MTFIHVELKNMKMYTCGNSVILIHVILKKSQTRARAKLDYFKYKNL